MRGTKLGWDGGGVESWRGLLLWRVGIIGLEYILVKSFLERHGREVALQVQRLRCEHAKD